MNSKKVIVSVEKLPDDIISYLNDNYKFIDLSSYLAAYKTIKDYNVDQRKKWDKVLKDLPSFEKPDIVIFRTYTILDKNLIDIFPQNILYLRAGSGYDNIDIKYAFSKGCFVENTPLANTNSAFEHTITLILASLKKLTHFDNSTKEGKWRNDLNLNFEADQKSICIVGYGHIGSKVAKFAKFLGMKVYIFDPVKSLIGYYDKLPEFYDYSEKVDLNFDYKNLYEILKKVDIVSLHIPLYDKTYKIIDNKFLNSLKDNAILVNTARGELFNKEDTVFFFSKNKDKFLAVDVFPNEPCDKFDEFFKLPNIIATPHIGAYTFEARQRLRQQVIRCIDAYFNEKKILHPVNENFYFSPYFKF